MSCNTDEYDTSHPLLLLPDAPYHKGLIYYIQAGGPKGPIKIGHVLSRTRLVQRRQNMQVGNHLELRWLAVEPGSVDREQTRHRHVKNHSIHGEWFHACPEIFDLVTKAWANLEKFLSLTSMGSTRTMWLNGTKSGNYADAVLDDETNLERIDLEEIENVIFEPRTHNDVREQLVRLGDLPTSWSWTQPYLSTTPERKLRAV